MDSKAFIKSYFTAVDAQDAQEVARFFTETGSFRFGNAPAVEGQVAVEQANRDFFGLIGGLQHAIIGLTTGVWEEGEVIAVELAVVYTRKDGSKTSQIPCVSVLRMKGEKIASLRIFGDMSELFAH